jgi:diguanylate cyclase (GGDEF)-like protein
VFVSHSHNRPGAAALAEGLARWRFIAGVFAWGLAFCLCLALPARLHAEQVELQNYGQADGLDNLTVMAIAQDAEGALWAGTENGLYRFDGQRFHRADRDHRLAQITAVVPDPQGGLWIAGNDNLYRWEAGRFERMLRPDGRPFTVQGSASMAIDGVGTAWVLSDSQLFEIRRSRPDGEWKVAEALEKPVGSAARPVLTSVAVDRAGIVWLACGSGLCQRNGRRLLPLVPDGAPDRAWTAILPARDGSLWLRSQKGMARLDRSTLMPVDHGLPDAAANIGRLSPAIVEDRSGRILTTGVSSIARSIPGGRHSGWELFDRQHGMPPGGRFLTLLVDREGGLWFSRAGGGLSRWVGYGQWEHWTRADGLPHDVVWSVVRDSAGILHAATSGGTARFDAETRRFVGDPETSGKHIGTLLADSRGRVWAGTLQSGVLLSGRSSAGRYVSADKSSAYTFLMHEGWDGRLWFATDEGFGWWPPAPANVLPKPHALVKEPLVSDFCLRRGGGWAASPEGLLRISDAGQLSPADNPLARLYSSVACARIGTVYASDDRGRIYQIQPDAKPPRTVDITPALLADRTVLGLLEDRRGWLWANTDAGVAVWNGRQWRLLDQSHGLIWNDTSGHGLFEDRDGTLWISTSQGLSHLLQPEAVFSPTLAAARIRSIVHGGQLLQPAGDLRLKWSRAEALEVSIESLSHAGRSTQAFEHRLLGFDDAWDRTGGSVIRYAGLPAGNYTLQARLTDQQLGLSGPIASLRLRIDPPWWETWTFRLLVGALLAALAYAAHRMRLRASRERERELAGLVAERTRELEASREELRERATKDGLTGAWNRQTVMEMLAHDIERSARDGQPLTVVLADIDHFKRINDELGHPAGDAVLRQFVARLRATVRPYDAIGRYGGEEFVVLLRGLGTALEADRARIETIHKAIAALPMPTGDGSFRTVTCSFGAAQVATGQPASQVEDVIQQADAALYRAKRAGRNRVEYAEPTTQAVGK